MGFVTGFCSAASVNSVPQLGKLGYPMGMAECAHGLVYRKIAVIESISVRKRVYHKIGRIPPFLVGGGMNATITIHRQM